MTSEQIVSNINQEIEILLVEDNPDDAEMTIRALQKHNFANKLLHLEDGALALEFLFAEGSYSGRQITRTPVIILLDLKMPKVGGIEVLQRIKADPRTKAVPVIVLTSSEEDPDVKTCYALGANSYIVKPVESESFYTAISALGFYWMIVNQPPHP